MTADWMVESMDGISKTISKEWVGLILLPAVSSIAGALQLSTAWMPSSSVHRVHDCDERVGKGPIDSQYQRCRWFDHR